MNNNETANNEIKALAVSFKNQAIAKYAKAEGIRTSTMFSQPLYDYYTRMGNTLTKMANYHFNAAKNS